MFGFTFQDVTREFPEMNRVYLARILAEMVDKGMLFKIARGNYHIIPFNADPETHVPEWHKVSEEMILKLQNKRHKYLFRAVNLADVPGPEHKIVIEKIHH